MKNWSLRKKLMGFAVLCTVFLFAVGAAGFYALESVSKPYDMIALNNMPKTISAAHMYLEQKNIVVSAEALLNERPPADEIAAVKQHVAQDIESFKASQLEYESKYRSKEEIDLYKSLLEDVQPFFDTANRIIELSARGTDADIALRDHQVAAEFESQRTKLRKNFDALLEIQKARTEFRLNEALNAKSTAYTLMFVALLSGVLLALINGYILARGLSTKLHTLAEELSEGADDVAASSTQLSGTSEELSAAASQQASSLQETSAAVQEISSMVSRNSDNAASCQASAHESQSTAQEGQRAVQEMSNAIQDINRSNTEIMQAVESGNAQIGTIVNMIRDIGEKTKIINDIVFQTKLLSFNASVEAARAGEQGKGFAVVAEEVGNLAQVSGNAAKEITSMLDNSIQKVEEIINSTKTQVSHLISEGRGKVESSNQVVVRCSEILNHIVDSSTKMTQAVSEISTASTEQAKGTEEISKAMHQLDQVTQQNTAASEHAAGAAAQLSNRADHLKESARALIELVEGGGHHGSNHRAPKASLKSGSPSGRQRHENGGHSNHKAA